MESGLLGQSEGGVISGCATKSEFKDLKNRMDALESNKIQSIEGQISSIDTSIGLLDQTDDRLEGYINALKEQVLELEVTEGEEREALEAAIKALQAEDESLHKQMEELKAYVDTELNGVKDWASATFVTLEEYNKTVDVITGIQAKIDSLQVDIAKEYEAAINEAIEKTAKSMESWVNEQLTGYYDIATMNTKLDSLKSALEKQIKEQGDEMEEQINQNTEDIEALQADLEQTVEDITDAYKEAIEDAIEENNGTITETIQEAIEGVNGTINALAGRVTALETAVGKLEERMDEVERTLKNLASITYIPKYADFAERVKYIGGDIAIVPEMTLRFDVYPTACADSIAKAYDKVKNSSDKNNSIFSARAVYTQTKASAGEFVNLPITKVEAEKDGSGIATGILSVSISPAALGADFFNGNLNASVVFKVSTDYSNVQSDYIQLVPEQSRGYLDTRSFERYLYSIMSTEDAPLQLSAIILADDAADEEIVWESSNSEIATVDGNGKVTPIGAGNAKITAKYVMDDFEHSTDYYVFVYKGAFVPVESVVISSPKDGNGINRDVTVDINVIISPENASIKAVTWTIQELDGSTIYWSLEPSDTFSLKAKVSNNCFGGKVGRRAKVTVRTIDGSDIENSSEFVDAYYYSGGAN